MKKILILSMLLIGCNVLAEVNLPGAPSMYNPSNSTYETPSSQYKKTTGINNTIPKLEVPTSDIPPVDNTKAKLDSLAMSALKAAEKHDEGTMNQYIQKMATSGAEGFSTPQIIAKKTPTCPPIKMQLNGRQLSGSVCAQMGYLYKGKQYDVGYCK